MLSKEVALRKILYRSVGQVSPRIIGTGIIPATLRNFNPQLLNLLKQGIPVFADGTFTTVKEEFQRMLDAKIIDNREEILLEHIKNLFRNSVKHKGRTKKQGWRKR